MELKLWCVNVSSCNIVALFDFFYLKKTHLKQTDIQTNKTNWERVTFFFYIASVSDYLAIEMAQAPHFGLAIQAEFTDKPDWSVLSVTVEEILSSHHCRVLYLIIMNNYCHLNYDNIIKHTHNNVCYFFFSVNFDHFQILRAIGKGSFGKVANLN